MSTLQTQQRSQTTRTNPGEGKICDTLHATFNNISTNSSRPLSTMTDQTMYENFNMKWDESLLAQRMAALRLESQKHLLNDFMLQKAHLQNASFTCPTNIHLRTPKPSSQRNRELYKTALCDFWSAGVPCRFGERCWFAHGPHELRIARFVYPGLNPYEYEVRSGDPNIGHIQNMSPYAVPPFYSRRFWNPRENYPIPSMPLTPMPITFPSQVAAQNIPIGFERKCCRTSPIKEHGNLKECWRTAARGASDGDSGLGSLGTTNSPEVNAKGRESLDGATYQVLNGNTFFPDLFGTEASNSSSGPPARLQPLNTLVSGQSAWPKSDRPWLNTVTEQFANMLPASSSTMGLEEAYWWPDIIKNDYPFINPPNQNNQSNSRTG